MKTIGRASDSKRFSPEAAWTPALVEGLEGPERNRGYAAITRTFLHSYASLKPFPLTVGEALFVVHLFSYKWDEQHPRPAYKTIARYMGISDKMARRHAQSLETKGYLRREVRTAKPNRFDLRPLFRALEAHVFGKVVTPELLNLDAPVAQAAGAS